MAHAQDDWHPVRPKITDPDLDPGESTASMAPPGPHNPRPAPGGAKPSFFAEHKFALIVAAVIFLIIVVAVYVYLTRQGGKKKKQEALPAMGAGPPGAGGPPTPEDLNQEELARLREMRRRARQGGAPSDPEAKGGGPAQPAGWGAKHPGPPAPSLGPPGPPLGAPGQPAPLGQPGLHPSQWAHAGLSPHSGKGGPHPPSAPPTLPGGGGAEVPSPWPRGSEIPRASRDTPPPGADSAGPGGGPPDEGDPAPEARVLQARSPPAGAVWPAAGTGGPPGAPLGHSAADARRPESAPARSEVQPGGDQDLDMLIHSLADEAETARKYGD